MLACELDYSLPPELIAQHPLAARDQSRLLVVGEGALSHRSVAEFPELLPEDALLVLNDTRVMKARVFAERASGGRIELLFLNPVPDQPEGTWEALVRSARRVKPEERLHLGEATLALGARTERGTRLVQVSSSVPELLEAHGHVPLPPYVTRPDDAADVQRYQTVFARHWGSAAAPTAGLHLTHSMLERVRTRGIEVGFVTLHVGAGTFKPVSTESLDEHPMHSESYRVGPELAASVARAKEHDRPVVAVGTTVVRALESAADVEGGLRVGEHETRLLIQPGYRFRVVDGLLTNFHAPRSTLLALVYALAGADRIRAAYAEAVQQRYRFLSYGDAMWIPPRSN
jgi:S-adenosylmethionine:tRNA ribosyltransferase-isomerase